MGGVSFKYTCPLCGEEELYNLPEEDVEKIEPDTIVKVYCPKCHRVSGTFGYILFGGERDPDDIVQRMLESIYKGLGMTQRAEDNPPSNGWKSLRQFIDQVIAAEKEGDSNS